MRHLLTNATTFRKKLSLANIYDRLRYEHVIVLTYHCSKAPLFYGNKDIKIETVSIKNINDALSYEPRYKVKTFARFLDRGDQGFYAYLNERFIHRSWVTFGPKKVHRWKRYAPLELKRGDAYIHWCETVPWARGMGVYPTVLNYIVNALSEKANEFYISTTIDNLASRKGIEKAGFQMISACKVKKLLGLQKIDNIGRGYLSDFKLL